MANVKTDKAVKICGVALELDLMDADVNEAVHKAADDCIAAVKAVSAEDIAEADKIRGICGAVRACFDTVFGKGTGATVCGERNRLDVCQQAFLDLCEGIRVQGDAYAKRAEKQTEKLQAALDKA